MSKYPRCAQCDKPLAVRTGIEREGVRVCGADCEYLYFGPPVPGTEVIIAGNVFRSSLVELERMNPDVDEAGILALYYLGWERVPDRGLDYEMFSKVRSWCVEP